MCSTYGDLSQGKATLGPSLVLIHPSYLDPHVLPFRNNVCDATVLQGMCCGRLWSYHIPLPRAFGLLLWLRSSVCYPLGIPLHLGCSTVPVKGFTTQQVHESYVHYEVFDEKHTDSSVNWFWFSQSISTNINGFIILSLFLCYNFNS